jgi:DNA-binding CsgD family transcriptional regulator
MLAARRLQALVSALFWFSAFMASLHPAIFIFVTVTRLPDEPLGVIGLWYEHPESVHYAYLLSMLFTTGYCFLASRWLKKQAEQQPRGKPLVKHRLFFSALFFILMVINHFARSIWHHDIRNFFLPLLVIGGMLLVLPLALMYLFTRFAQGTGVQAPLPPEPEPAIPPAAAPDIPPEWNLSRREREVVEAVRQGRLRYKELGLALGISSNTVKWHLTRIYDAAGVSSIGELAALVRLTHK